MKCPHCNSLMNIYETATTDKSQVFFYRCTICIAEHVSSSMLTTAQLEPVPDQNYFNSRPSSQNFSLGMS